MKTNKTSNKKFSLKKKIKNQSLVLQVKKERKSIQILMKNHQQKNQELKLIQLQNKKTKTILLDLSQYQIKNI